MTLSLLHADWRAVVDDVPVDGDGYAFDAVITDPPFSRDTHVGFNAAKRCPREDGVQARRLDYDGWTPHMVASFVHRLAPLTRCWFACLTDDVLAPAYRRAYRRVGFADFAQVPCVIRGMTCRHAGDGPSSEAVYLMVGRRRGKASHLGTKPGYYVVPREAGLVRVGGKPLGLMQAIVRDYTLPGWRVVDPCAGGGTTLVACASLGRSCLGIERDLETFNAMQARVAEASQPVML